MSHSLSPVEFASNANNDQDHQVMYRFTSSSSRHAGAAARTFDNGVNQKWLELDQVSAFRDTLVITYSERVKVELQETTTGFVPRCSCVMYLEARSCGHTPHAVDAIMRASINQPDQQVIYCDVYQDHSTSAMQATYESNGADVDINPTRIDLDRLDEVIRHHTYAETKFKVIVNNVREVAGQIFRYQSENENSRHANNFELIRGIEGGMEYSTSIAVRDLTDEASRLNTAFEAFAKWAVSMPVFPLPKYQEGVDEIVRVYIFLMRGILASIGQHNIKTQAADELYRGKRPRNFWQQADNFFKAVNRQRHFQVGIRDGHVADLVDLREFIRRNYEDPIDGSVDRLFQQWLPVPP